MKLQRAGDGRLMFFCPGCQCSHGVFADGDNRPVWSWNGSMSIPTFAPSIRVRWEEGNGKPQPKVCHSFVTGGMIKFLPDSTHALAGLTVEIPEWEG